MAHDHFPIGQEMDITYSEFTAHLTVRSSSELHFTIDDGPFAHSETVQIEVTPLGNGLFTVSWQEASGATVVHVQDYDRNTVNAFVTLPDGGFMRLVGRIDITKPADAQSDARPERNKALVLEAMTSLFQRRDPEAVNRLYTTDYVQHNPYIPQGRRALRALVAEMTSEVWYEPGLMIAEGDFVAIHGRIRGWSDKPQIVVDLFRVQDGQLAEHWDVLQDEVAPTATEGSSPMFDPDERSLQR